MAELNTAWLTLSDYQRKHAYITRGLADFRANSILQRSFIYESVTNDGILIHQMVSLYTGKYVTFIFQQNGSTVYDDSSDSVQVTSDTFKLYAPAS